MTEKFSLPHQFDILWCERIIVHCRQLKRRVVCPDQTRFQVGEIVVTMTGGSLYLQMTKRLRP